MRDNNLKVLFSEKNTVQSYGCKITLPVDMGSFGYGGGQSLIKYISNITC